MKLFSRHKPKAGKNASSGSRDFQGEDPGKQSIATPLYQKLATHGSNPALQQTQGQQQQQQPDERWEVVAPPDHLATPQQQQQQNAHVPSRTASQNSLTHPAIAIASGGAQMPQQQRTQQQQQRSASPMSLASVANGPTKPQSGLLKKKPPSTAPVVGILRALEPPRSSDHGHGHPGRGSQSEEYLAGSDTGHGQPVEKKEKRGFWGGSKDKDRDKEREREREKEREAQMYAIRERESMHRERVPDEGPAELTRMIGYLTATASEDWTLVLEVCDRASSSETNAKEAIRALRREFKYGEPPAQLSAARLWAIMLRNSSDTFISQSTSRKFLDTLEDLLQSSRTSPVVRERLLEVVAAAAYASGAKKDPRENRDGFKGLWRRVKPFDKPDEGVPFDTDDAMFNPPVSGRLSGYEVPMVQYQEATPLPDANNNPPSTPSAIPAALTPGAQPQPPAHTVKKKKSPSSGNRIIPREEDIRRLFQECHIGQGNASLLSQALALSKPEDLEKKSVIKEFHAKCRSSQELIFAQIPWASAGAERSRVEVNSAKVARGNNGHARKRTISNNELAFAAEPGALDRENGDASPTDSDETVEEKLLAALLQANEELVEALKQYDDLARIAMERRAEERSRREARKALKQQQQQLQREYSTSTLPVEGGEHQQQQYDVPSRSESPDASVSSSRSPSPLPPGATMITPYQLAPSTTGSVPYSDQTMVHEGYHHPGAAPLPPQQQYLPNQQYQHPQHQQYLQQQQQHQQQLQQRGLAPPMAAPHGPRSPGHVGAAASIHSRASSPGTPKLEPTRMGTGAGAVVANGHPQDVGDEYGDDGDDASELDMALEAPAGLGVRRYDGDAYRDAGAYRDGDRERDAYREKARDREEYGGEEWERPVQPSAKALGKRKVVEPEPLPAPVDQDDMYYDGAHPFGTGDATDPEFEDDADSRARRPPVNFVYDAVAERSRQIQQQLEMQKAAAALTLNPVGSAH
ncbi:hypothetical protein D9619_011864 [Psilocybe cf. subviscida]|uniref:VHS domain-containing protein n=1 Tax=Psilocybe cf. subviscida TaxID=2480587 RepID=A0A8H5B0C2_9AGAR|nr:hypothetical protein D9619_011864 [Psilocybe cf. subviscida]